MEGGLRIGCDVPAREISLPNYRSRPIRSRHALGLPVPGDWAWICSRIEFGTVGFCARPGPPRQVDAQRRDSMGSLSTPAESECGESAFGDRPLCLFRGPGFARVVRPGFSNAGFRKHSLVQFAICNLTQSARAAAASAALARQLL